MLWRLNSKPLNGLNIHFLYALWKADCVAVGGGFMKTIVVAAQKGGSGKSTITAHLSVEFIRQGLTVAVLDLDRQGSISFWRSQRQHDEPEVSNVGFGEFQEYHEHCEEEGFDILLVDTPPHAGAGIQAVTSLGDLVIVPVRPGPLDVAALGGTIRFLKPENTIIVLNQVPAVGTEADEARQLLAGQYANFSVAQTTLGLRKAYSQALIAGLSIVEFERPNAKAVSEIKAFFEEVMECVK